MEHWNKGGLTREEFLRMREDAMRKLQEMAKKQTSGPQRPVFASVPPEQPRLQKPKAPLTVPAQEEPVKAPTPDAPDAAPVKKGVETPPGHPPKKPLPDSSAPEKPNGDPPSAAGPGPHPPQPFLTETAEEVPSPVPEEAPEALPPEEPPDIMPSEGLLQTIQDISQAMGDPDFSREGLPDAFGPDAKEDPKPIPGPPEAQTTFAEPVFVPPLPYHPDGFIPRRPRRAPSFHPDAVRPEKGCYQPPRPAERPSYHPENQKHTEEDKKK